MYRFMIGAGIAMVLLIAPAWAESGADQIELVRQWMDRGRRAIAGEEYEEAVRVYTKVLDLLGREPPKGDELATWALNRRLAHEYLGVARDRRGQLAHAKAEYQEYLRLYPEGEESDRVRQRLSALLSARTPLRDALKSGQRASEQVQWSAYGGLSQFYDRDVRVTDAEGDQVTRSILRSDADVTARRRGRNMDLRLQFSGGYDYDFLDSSESELRVSTLFLDVVRTTSDWSGRFGRQSRSSGGVLGRFDGATLRYGLTPRRRIDLVAGYPVDLSNRGTIQTDQDVIGASLELDAPIPDLDAELFAVQQQARGVLNRRAIGGELRWFREGRSLFGLFDYDLSYHTPTTALVLGTWLFEDRSTLHFNIDYRTSPILTTDNALTGQTVTELDQLVSQLGEEAVRQLALDRTADSRSWNVGGSRPISEDLQWSMDLTRTTLTAMPASGGVEAIPGSDEWSWSGQLIGSDLIKQGDIGILGLVYSLSDDARRVRVDVNSRYPINGKWRINPRLRLDYRVERDGDGRRFTVQPSIRAEYRARQRTRVDIEVGGDWTEERIDDQSDSDRGSFLSLGYRVDF